eukprot:FR743124.1.p2 GENE.FR743124.1~~FR743124.1.p2  ORF type:complete len:141 (+),score=23.29 FR743124.1:561-983(+)
MEMKGGWVHSSSMQFKFFLSFSDRGTSLSSRQHHVATTSTPPGLSTLAICSTYAFLSGMCSPLSQAHTMSKLLSGKVIANASLTWKVALSNPRSLGQGKWPSRPGLGESGLEGQPRAQRDPLISKSGRPRRGKPPLFGPL